MSGGIAAANCYRYDPLNYRISKNDSRGSRADYLEGEHLEASYNGALPTARYVRGVVRDGPDRLDRDWGLLSEFF